MYPRISSAPRRAWSNPSELLRMIVVAGVVLPQIAGATDVSGLLAEDAVWTLPGSPYVVTGNVLVGGDATLTIEPGVTVAFDSGNSLQIAGVLVARGTSDDTIVFTSNLAEPAPGDWGTILFSDSSADATFDVDGNFIDGSIIEYATVEYGGNIADRRRGALMMNGAHPFITRSTIRRNDSSGIYAWNISANLRISNNVISDNAASDPSYGQGGAVYADGTGVVSLSGNIMARNSAYGRGSAIMLWWIAGTVENNLIMENESSYGGAISSGYRVTFDRNIVVSNIGGAFDDLDYPVISNNSILGNEAPDSPVIKGGWISTLQNNTIVANRATDTESTTALSVRNTYFVNLNNVFANATDFAIRNENAAGSNQTDATENWWGTAVDADIQSLVYDWFDDSASGIIDYTPFLVTPNTDSPISPPMGLEVLTTDSSSVTIGWDPSPESDALGYRVYWGDGGELPFENVVDVGNVLSFRLSGLAQMTYSIGVTAYDTNYAATNDDPESPVNERQTSGNESWYARIENSMPSAYSRQYASTRVTRYSSVSDG